MRHFLYSAAVSLILLFSASVSAQVDFVQRANDTRTPQQFQADCAAGVALETCAPMITPHSCPPGEHWSLAGTGIAHCVADDPVCGPGTTLTHDALGNPSCTPNPVVNSPSPPAPTPAPAAPANTCTPTTTLVGSVLCPTGSTGTQTQYSNTGCDASGNVIPEPDTYTGTCTPNPATPASPPPSPPACTSITSALAPEACSGANVIGFNFYSQTVNSCTGTSTSLTSSTCACAPGYVQNGSNCVVTPPSPPVCASPQIPMAGGTCGCANGATNSSCILSCPGVSAYIGAGAFASYGVQLTSDQTGTPQTPQSGGCGCPSGTTWGVMTIAAVNNNMPSYSGAFSLTSITQESLSGNMGQGVIYYMYNYSSGMTCHN